ncbi:hypothetical protein FM104_02710 [Microbacterium esteraromaticum]|uniref:Uncharacterized protein n=1 Tax=Microbacterium esteraromaticum TaxID=57043 RepID=A0A1R4IKS8_9MICO|nr:helix-turn-helix transcriptional regulator [Microbacterium esteraromaticum]SJN20480.1 hypothetical protein FM104_02710 [Microbacterium esteraromaticum]
MTEGTISSGAEPASFAEALRAAIQARGITLARLHDRLADRGNAVSMATLSYWRSGARRPEGVQSLAAIADIEQLLDVPQGALLGRLGPTMRTGPLGPTAFPFEVETLEDRVRETFVAMGGPYPDPTRELMIHAVTDIGPDRQVLRRTTRLLVQATSGVVAATPFVEMSPGEPMPAPEFEAIGGGRVSKTYSHSSDEVHGFLFEFDRPIEAPESTLIEWSVRYPDGFAITDEAGYGVALQARELLVWTRFDAEAVPDWCEEVEETPEGVVVTRRELDGARSVHAVRRNFGPGALSMRWGYGERRSD